MNNIIKKVIFALAVVFVIIGWNKLFSFLDNKIPTYEGNLIFLRYWTRYLVLSFPVMILVGKILKNRDSDAISIIKIVSAVVMTGLSALVIIEARWGIVKLLDGFANGDGFVGLVSFVVLGTVVVAMLYFVYFAIAALAAGMTIKQIMTEAIF